MDRAKRSRWGRLAVLVALLAPGLLMAGAGAPAGAGAEEHEGQIAYLALHEGAWQVWVAAPDGSGARVVTRSEGDKIHCSWYPSGEALLVDRLDATPVRVDPEIARETELSLPFASVVDSVVAPGGKRIAFSATTTGAIDSNEIWLSGPGGKSLRRLTEMSALQHGPVWSPDGAWIYFLSGKGEQAHDIWRVSADGKRREQITAGSLYHFELAMSPTGTLAFSSNRTGNYELWIRERGGEPLRLTADPAFDGEPTWSPDGEWILFTSTRAGPPNLWRIAPRPGAEPVQVTHTESGARGAAWWGADAGSGNR